MINNPWNTPSTGTTPATPSSSSGYPPRNSSLPSGLQPTPDYGSSTIGGSSYGSAANDTTTARIASSASAGTSLEKAEAEKPDVDTDKEDPAEAAMLASLHPDLQTAFRKARELAVQLKHFEITPLHLLTVMAGIPSQTVREQLRQIGYDNGERVRLRKYLLHMAIDTGDMTSDDYPARPAWSSDVREQLLNRAREVAKERGDDAKITVKDIFEALKRSGGDIPASRYLLDPERRPKTKIQEEMERVKAELTAGFEAKLRQSEAQARETVSAALQEAQQANKRASELQTELGDVMHSVRWLVSELERTGHLVVPQPGHAEAEANGADVVHDAPVVGEAAANGGEKTSTGRKGWFSVASFFF